jgi:hypothetical protein
MLVAGYAVLSFMFSFSRGNAVAHLIHLGGIAVALAYLIGIPKIEAWYRKLQDLRHEMNMRARTEHEIGRKQYYEERVGGPDTGKNSAGRGGVVDERRESNTGRSGEIQKE